tara:strand:+ start:285 stop:488 length:204 start_codon:yes stop_codon:yes gene_type:complete
MSSKNSKTSVFSNIIKSVNVSQLPEQSKSYNKISIKSVKYERNNKKKDIPYLDQLLNKSFLNEYFKS